MKLSKPLSHEEVRKRSLEIEQAAAQKILEGGRKDAAQVSQIWAEADMEKQKLGEGVPWQSPFYKPDPRIEGAETVEELQAALEKSGGHLTDYSNQQSGADAIRERQRSYLGGDTERLDVDSAGNRRTDEAIAARLEVALEAAETEEERIDAYRRAGLIANYR